MRWGQDRERHLLQHGSEPEKKEAPTLKEFAPKFLESYAQADRHKPSGIASKESILRIHLIPFFGTQKLDAITNAKVQELKLAGADDFLAKPFDVDHLIEKMCAQLDIETGVLA